RNCRNEVFVPVIRSSTTSATQSDGKFVTLFDEELSRMVSAPLRRHSRSLMSGAIWRSNAVPARRLSPREPVEKAKLRRNRGHCCDQRAKTMGTHDFDSSSNKTTLLFGCP